MINNAAALQIIQNGHEISTQGMAQGLALAVIIMTVFLIWGWHKSKHK